MQLLKTIGEILVTSGKAHAHLGEISLQCKKVLELASHAETSDICVTLKRLQETQKTYDAFAKELATVIERFKTEIIPAKFAEKKVSSVSVEGYRFTLSESVRASITDKDAGYAWLRENELGDLITETVNASTLAAQARKLMEDGFELPQDIFRTYLQPNVSVTKV